MQIFPALPYRSDETVLSWAARLAAFHTGGRLVPFLHDIGIKPNDLSAGGPDAVRHLCEKVGQDLEPVRRNVIARIATRHFALRDETFSAEFTTGVITRFCPACLACDNLDDRSPHIARSHRLIWTLRPVHICPDHKILMLERRGDKWDDFLHELADLVPETRAQLLNLAGQAPGTEPSELQSYVLARLDGASGPAWLDRQPIEQAVKATEMLGAVIAFGTEAKAADLGPMDWVHAAKQAWPYVRDGEDGLRRAFCELQEAAKGHGRDWLRRKGVFGMLYAWLSAGKLRKDPGSIRDVLRAHIVETMDVGPGETLLGEVVTQPRISSVITLAKTYHVHELTLRDVLVSRNLLDADAAFTPCSELLVDAGQGRLVAEAINCAIPVTQAGSFLNATRPMVSTLVEIGALTQLKLDGEPRGKLSRSIDRRQMVAFLDRIEAKITGVVDAVPAGMTDISGLLERSRITNEKLFRLLLTGRLRRLLRLKDVPGIKGLVLDPREFSTADQLPMPGMSLEMARLTLGLSEAAIRAITKDRSGGAFLKSDDIGGAHEKWIWPEAMTEFRKRYVFAHRFKLEFKCERSTVRSRLESVGAKPVVEPRKLGATLYVRDEVIAALQR
ncbi:TniQ family protein [Phaeovulum sp. NW3]|uniref:TniQ family protein n=1 Tax=Phaeovulum sp. NW3 TaxID=2934933 RepID=UPI002021F1BD|nr:TniQ family protein [Phaeovulum sp. NW3]MCL7466747.1 TniQ family protein [Phaeovulum sp. NW3]